MYLRVRKLRMCVHLGEASIYSKTCRKLDKKYNQIIMTNYRLMKVESIAECSPLEHSAIILTCIKR